MSNYKNEHVYEEKKKRENNILNVSVFRFYVIVVIERTVYTNDHDFVLKYTTLSSNSRKTHTGVYVGVYVSLVDFPSAQCAAPQGLSVVWQPMLWYLTCTRNRVPSAHIHSLYLSRPSLKYRSPPREVSGMRDGLNITEPFRIMLFSCGGHGEHGLPGEVDASPESCIDSRFIDFQIELGDVSIN